MPGPGKIRRRAPLGFLPVFKKHEYCGGAAAQGGDFMKRVEEDNSTQKTVEDYLEAILQIHDRQGYVRSIDVAEQLEVSKPSVTYTTKRLREKNYITTDHAGMLVLTDTGRAIAENTLNRHHVLTRFLEQIGVNHEQAQTDACKVEHDLSEESFQAIARLATSMENLDNRR